MLTLKQVARKSKLSMRTRQSTHESQLIVNKYFNLSSRLYEVNFKVIFLGNLKVRFPKKLTFFHTLLHPVAASQPHAALVTGHKVS
jgi:hypothetical protein